MRGAPATHAAFSLGCQHAGLRFAALGSAHLRVEYTAYSAAHDPSLQLAQVEGVPGRCRRHCFIRPSWVLPSGAPYPSPRAALTAECRAGRYLDIPTYSTVAHLEPGRCYCS